MKLLSAASTILLLARAASSNDCPPELKNSKTLTTSDGRHTITIDYAIILSFVSDSLNVLCVRIETDAEGYIGFAVSPSGTMDGAEAIIGKPDDANDEPGTVLKYSLAASREVKLMPEERQTLTSTSVSRNDDGHTTMEFAKLMEEDGEYEIYAQGDNTFLYALGPGSDLGFHTHRDSFEIDFDTTRKPSSSSTTLAPSYGGVEVSSPGNDRTLNPTVVFRRGDPIPTLPPDPDSSPPGSANTYSPTPERESPTPTAPAPESPTPAAPASESPTPAAPAPESITPVAPASDSPTPAAPAPESTTPAATAPAVSTPDAPSGATVRKNIWTVVLGAGAVAIWFGM